MTVEVIEGPLISASDLAAHRQLFCRGFMMEEVAHERLNADATARLFGIARHSAALLTLQTPSTAFGASRSRPRDSVRMAHLLIPVPLKVIDFYARGFELGLAHVEEVGFQVRGDTAGHIEDVATVTDRQFSEPHSMSGPVTSLEKAQRFLELGLGLTKAVRLRT